MFKVNYLKAFDFCKKYISRYFEYIQIFFLLPLFLLHKPHNIVPLMVD